MAIFGFGKKRSPMDSMEREIRQRKKAEAARERAKEKTERLEERRKKEIEYLRKGTELYTARGKYKKAKYYAKHPVKKRPLITIKKKKAKGKIRLF